jgi:hypothetical protein
MVTLKACFRLVSPKAMQSTATMTSAGSEMVVMILKKNNEISEWSF